MLLVRRICRLQRGLLYGQVFDEMFYCINKRISKAVQDAVETFVRIIPKDGFKIKLHIVEHDLRRA